MKAQFINLFWSVWRKGRGCWEPCSRGWARRACCLHHRPTARAPPAPRLVAPVHTFGRVGERWAAGQVCGDPSSPPNPLPRGQPQAAREAVGSSLARQHQHGLPMWGPGRVRAALEGLRLFRPKSPNRRQGQPWS